ALAPPRPPLPPPPPQLLDLPVPPVPGRRRQAGPRARVGGLAPLHDVGGVQPFTAQDRAPLAAVGSVVLGQDRRLVLRGGHAALWPLSSRSHAPIINGGIGQGHRHRLLLASRPVQREETQQWCLTSA